MFSKDFIKIWAHPSLEFLIAFESDEGMYVGYINTKNQEIETSGSDWHPKNGCEEKI